MALPLLPATPAPLPATAGTQLIPTAPPDAHTVIRLLFRRTPPVTRATVAPQPFMSAHLRTAESMATPS